MAKRVTRPRTLTARERQEVIRDNPEKILEEMRKGGKVLLGDLLPGQDMAALRAAVDKVGFIEMNDRQIHIKTRNIPGTDEKEVMAIGALVDRDPGRAQDWIQQVQDFQLNLTPQLVLVRMFWNVYKNEGVVNNAVNKIAAVLSSGGSFRVRNAKKGKMRNAPDVLEELLYQWTRDVNAAAIDSAVKGDRGLKAVTAQGVRHALIEGSWIARTVWQKHNMGSWGTFSLPMIIQTITTEQIEPAVGIDTSGLDLFYWRPPQALVNQVKNPTDKMIKQYIQRFIPKDVISQITKDSKVLLDPALMLHVKHRGSDRDTFGESFIRSALPAISYRKALLNLDLVTMENLINRLTIVMVGSADPDSPYSSPSVSAARASLMQSFFATPGPNMTIVWQGNDVEVKDVGAQSLLDTDKRHGIADGKVKEALGVPDALLSGNTPDGKAAGWAAMLGTAAELEELQNAFAQAWTTVGERIALENGFQDVDLVFQFDHQLTVDRSDELNQTRQDYVAGGISIRSFLESRGKDPDAEFQQMCFEKGLDPDTALWKDAFAPPQGLPGQGGAEPGDGTDPGKPAPPQGQGKGKTPGTGRQPNSQTGKTTQERAPKNTPEENK